MADEFEAKIRELYKEVFPLWNNGEVAHQPDRLKNHNLMVIYLKNAYDYLHDFEQKDFSSKTPFHPNPILNITQGAYSQYEDFGINREEAGELLDSISKSNRSKQNKEQYIADIKRVIELEKIIFELTE